MGPYTHPSLPLSSEPVNLTGVWDITIKKFEVANAIGEFQSRNEGEILEVKIEDKARSYGSKRPRIEGKARTEGVARDRAREGSGEGAR